MPIFLNILIRCPSGLNKGDTTGVALLDLTSFIEFVKFPMLYLVSWDFLLLKTKDLREPFALTLFGPFLFEDYVVVLIVKALITEPRVSEYFF